MRDPLGDIASHSPVVPLWSVQRESSMPGVISLPFSSKMPSYKGVQQDRIIQ